jgi:prepilin-type N-terminal cleavage/methylation domain-containing protein/prepilin-type processing-associated H-X9-DG protein
MTPRRRRRGFTLIELLVVISIIGVLVGLLLPAVQSAREAGRRAQCQSNMHNLTLAVQGYINSKNVYPPAGVFCEDATTLQSLASGAIDPTQSVILTYMPGAGTPRGNPMYSWVIPLLPYLENQELYNQWTMFYTPTGGGSAAANYFDGFTGTPTYLNPGQASNWGIGKSAIKVLQCPDDNTVQTNQGNLSYVVNGGFALWHAAPFGWVGSQIDGAATHTPTPLTWAPPVPAAFPANYAATIGVTQKLGVMFLESTFPPGVSTRIPWNVHTTTAIADGASNTLLLSENTLTGVGTPTPYSNGLETNWAAPMPTFSTFIGPSNVCGVPNTTDCTAGQLAPLPPPNSDTDGPGWAFANKVGTFTNINFGQNLTIEGSFPFTNSSHPSGSNMGFCDGSVRFITNTIDGTVYSKLITPAGSRLPIYAKQLPVSQDAFAQ